MATDECWVVETSRDGERWRPFGKAWKQPGEQMLLHAAPRFVRYRRLDGEAWQTLSRRNVFSR